MKYTFYKEIINEIVTLGIMPKEKKYKILFRFGDSGWTPTKVQEIINGIEASKEKPKGEEYIWANEDVTVYSNKNGVLLIDMISQRFGIHDPDKITLTLIHEELLTFLEDFKTFVAENS